MPMRIPAAASLFLTIVCNQAPSAARLPANLASPAVASAEVAPQSKGSHRVFLDDWSDLDDSAYEAYLDKYDAYQNAHPDDIDAAIERCEFIRGSGRDDGDDSYGGDGEDDGSSSDHQQCLEELGETFPDSPRIKIYRADFLTGDSAIAFISSALEDKRSREGAWKGVNPAPLYRKLAEEYEAADSGAKAVAYGRLAMLHDDTLDLTVMMAEIDEKAGRLQAARSVLLERLDSLQSPWTLNRKGDALLRLDRPADAARAFGYARKRPEGWSDPLRHGEALEKAGRRGEAADMYREAAGEGARDGSRRGDALMALFEYQLRYGPADSAALGYARLRDLGFSADPFGRYRLALFLHHPFLPWKSRDWLGFLGLLALTAVAAVLPAFIVCPIHYFGLLLRAQGNAQVSPSSGDPSAPSDFAQASSLTGELFVPKVSEPALSVRNRSRPWNLGTLWALISMYFTIQALLMILFDYPQLQALFHKQGQVSWTGGYGFELPDFPDAAEMARTFMAYACLMAATGAVFLRKTGLGELRGRWPWVRVVSIGIFAAICLRLISAGVDRPGDLAGQTRDMVALGGAYGWWAVFLGVVVLAPFYEEIMFRGVMLRACEAHIGPRAANLLQAALFAFMHVDKPHFLFFTLFGITAGILRRASGGLAAGILAHASFNLVAFAVLSHAAASF